MTFTQGMEIPWLLNSPFEGSCDKKVSDAESGLDIANDLDSI